MHPVWLYGVQVLDADPELTTRFSGRPQTEEHFGSDRFSQPQSYNHLLGSIYYEESQETVLVFGFRLSEAFYHEWKMQGEAQLLFNVIKFHEGDARKICPIHVVRLASDESPYGAATQTPQEELGIIMRDELQLDRLYSYVLAFREDLSPGDIIWIGLDATNPIEPDNHNLLIAGDLNAHPGGSPPMIVAGDAGAASLTVHGISLLQSLNRRFYAPKSDAEILPEDSAIPRWINPFRTAQKLDTLKGFRHVLEQELAKLPENPVIVPERFKGFHSSVKKEGEGWELRFPVSRRVTSIALYPALRQNGIRTEVYAFPKRFTITAIPRNEDNPVMVADWSQADFPQEGFSPVIFPFDWKFYEEVCLTVHEGTAMSGGHAFALSEVSFPRRYSTWPIALIASPDDSLESPPYWSRDYATDGQTAFGAPVSPVDPYKGTFRTVPQGDDPIQIILRLDKPTLWNSFDFHPTEHPDGLPPEGFPGGFRVEFSNQDDFSDILRVESTTEPVNMASGKFPYTMQFPRIDARCVRITLIPRQPPTTKPLLQLEEITFNGGLPLNMDGWYMEDRSVTGTPGTGALYDRIVNGCQWDPPVRRSVNLIRREVLTDELHRVESMMQAIRRSDARTMTRLKGVAVVLAASLSGLFIVHQRRQSRKVQLRIRHRIQQDLHDEIGSQLSAISMITNFNKNDPGIKPEMRTELADANHCARSAIASLAEVIWLTDKEILTLDQCFDVMKNRAEKMVHSMKLEIDFPKKVPPIKLSYQTKRNLILLFTEALNNALKHSRADTISIGAELDNTRRITLSISDNGQGFSPGSNPTTLGLTSMNARARKLKGSLDIISVPNEGTTVRFKGKL